MKHAFIKYLENKRRKAQRQGAEKARDAAKRKEAYQATY